MSLESRREGRYGSRVHRRSPLLSFLLLFGLALSFFACDACRGPGKTETPAAPETPTLRLYLISDLAGALEPCGCVKDQLGGMDHLAALVAKEATAAKKRATLAVGPTFFMDPALTEDRRAQEIAKAETIGKSLKELGVAAVAPAKNDWAGGAEALGRLAAATGADLVAANVEGAGTPLARFAIVEAEGIKVGVVGVSGFGPPASEGGDPDGGVSALASAKVSPAVDAARAAAEEAKAKGAQAIVVLAATGRGDAKRIADVMPDALAVVVGSTGSSGDANTPAAPAERVGDVLVVQAANHLQTVGVIDLYVRPGSTKFADGTGIDAIRKREELTKRIDDLRVKIAVWEKDGTAPKADVDARRADLAKLTAERDAFDKTPPPKQGSFFRYAMRDVRADLGDDAAVKAHMLAYYKKVNEENRAAFAERKPPAPAAGEPAYAGIDMCENCHEEAKAVWDKTAHAHAYKTLADQFKEFNLDCVSCHVTGYGRPGGSTVTYVAELKNVQCEVCHGPGSLHAKAPNKVKPPVPKPSPDMCAACHHPPHVHEFDAKAKMSAILGPGHGQPKK